MLDQWGKLRAANVTRCSTKPRNPYPVTGAQVIAAPNRPGHRHEPASLRCYAMQHEIKKSVPCNRRSSCCQTGKAHYKANPNRGPRGVQRMHKNAQSCPILHKPNSPNPASISLKINGLGFDCPKAAARPRAAQGQYLQTERLTQIHPLHLRITRQRPRTARAENPPVIDDVSAVGHRQGRRPPRAARAHQATGIRGLRTGSRGGHLRTARPRSPESRHAFLRSGRLRGLHQSDRHG